jgi:hypothetical protein
MYGRSLDAGAWQPYRYLVFGEPTVAALGVALRLRGLRGSAADPSNLIQVMLAKGSLLPPLFSASPGDDHVSVLL